MSRRKRSIPPGNRSYSDHIQIGTRDFPARPFMTPVKAIDLDPLVQAFDTMGEQLREARAKRDAFNARVQREPWLLANFVQWANPCMDPAPGEKPLLWIFINQDYDQNWESTLYYGVEGPWVDENPEAANLMLQMLEENDGMPGGMEVLALMRVCKSAVFQP